MEEVPGEHFLPPKEEESSAEIVGATGLAKDLLDRSEDSERDAPLPPARATLSFPNSLILLVTSTG